MSDKDPDQRNIFMLTFEKLKERHEQHHNDVCILYDCDIVRLVGVGDDGDGYYYIVRGCRPNKTVNVWASAVGSILSLRGLIPEERYEQMDRQLTLNGAGPSEEFILGTRSETK